MISLTSDVADLILQRTLNQNTIGLNTAIERMTTGYKVNHAKDNAANFSIVTDLSKKISSMLQIQQNTEDGVAMLQTAEGGLEQIQELLERLRDLSMQAANGTYDVQSRDAMQAEADEIIAQIEQIKNSVKYNGISLFETRPSGSGVASSLLNAAQVSVLSAETPVESEVSTNLPYNENNIISGAKGLAKSRASSPAAFSLSETDEGAIDFSGKQKITFNVDNVTYTVTNNLDTAQTLSYVKDKSTGELTFLGSNFTIEGQKNVAHNLIIDGSNNTVYGGDLNDKIVEQAIGCRDNNIYGGAGNDEIVLNGTSNAYGEDGNDTLTANGITISAALYGGAGDDIINANAPQSIVYAGDGNDIINVNNSKVRVFAEDGDDTINILSGTDSIIDGGSGTNIVTGNITNNTVGNVVGANSKIEDFNGITSKVVNINGIDYTITKQTGASDTFIYQIEEDGQINFKSDAYKIEGDLNKAHNVKLSGARQTFCGGNLADRIESVWINSTIYGLDGDDTIISSAEGAIIYGGNDNDVIISSGNFAVILGENGNDDITINGDSSYCDAGDGDDNVTVNRRRYNAIIGGSGKNTITNNGIDTFINGFGDKDNSNTVELINYDKKVVNINSRDYELQSFANLDNNNKKFLYSVNTVTGEISMWGNRVTIKSQSNVSHNTNIYGNTVNFYGGDLDDNINVYAAYGCAYGEGGNDTLSSYVGGGIKLSGGDGDDVLTSESYNGFVYGDAGDDEITINAYTISAVDGGLGNDTYNINASCSPSDNSGNNVYNINIDGINVSGGAGDDTFYVKSDNNIVKGAGGNDYYVVDGSNNNLDGGTGQNFYVDNGSNNTFTNTSKDPNSGVLVFAYQGEEKTFTLDNKTYTVTNNLSGSNTLQYSLNPNTKVVTIDGSEFQVNSESDKQTIMNVRGNNNTINGSDLADRIIIEQGSNNVVNGLDGDDTLIMNSANNSLNGGLGNDTITLNASTNLEVTGGDGNDTINVNSSENTNISAGNGNNIVNVAGQNNKIDLSDGNNKITISKDGNDVTAGNGNNNIVISSNNNTITTGSGNNTIGLQGNQNNIDAENIFGEINIYGDNNTFHNDIGVNKVNIKGSGNTYTTETGDKEISIKGNNNNVTGGSGADNIKINGNSNTVNGGDADDAFLISGGTNNTIDGNNGRDTLVDNGKNTTFTNVIDITPKPFEARVKVDIGGGSNKYINTTISFNLFDFGLDLSTQEGALEGIENIDEMIKTVQEQILNIGTSVNRLKTVLEAQSSKLENMISTRSTLQDSDIAKESSDFIRYQILQQASTTLMAASRNIKAGNVLGLLESVRTNQS